MFYIVFEKSSKGLPNLARDYLPEKNKQNEKCKFDIHFLNKINKTYSILPITYKKYI